MYHCSKRLQTSMMTILCKSLPEYLALFFYFYHAVVHKCMITVLMPTMFSLPVRVQTLTAPELEMATTTSSVKITKIVKM